MKVYIQAGHEECDIGHVSDCNVTKCSVMCLCHKKPGSPLAPHVTQLRSDPDWPQKLTQGLSAMKSWNHNKKGIYTIYIIKLYIIHIINKSFGLEHRSLRTVEMFSSFRSKKRRHDKVVRLLSALCAPTLGPRLSHWLKGISRNQEFAANGL